MLIPRFAFNKRSKGTKPFDLAVVAGRYNKVKYKLTWLTVVYILNAARNTASFYILLYVALFVVLRPVVFKTLSFFPLFRPKGHLYFYLQDTYYVYYNDWHSKVV